MPQYNSSFLSAYTILDEAGWRGRRKRRGERGEQDISWFWEISNGIRISKMKKLGVSSKSKVRQLVTIKGRRCAETKNFVPDHKSKGLTPGLWNSIAQTPWRHSATYYGNHAKTRRFLVANMASHPSPSLPAGLVLAICTLHSHQLSKARVGRKRGRQCSGVQRTVDGTFSCRS